MDIQLLHSETRLTRRPNCFPPWGPPDVAGVGFGADHLSAPPPSSLRARAGLVLTDREQHVKPVLWEETSPIPPRCCPGHYTCSSYRSWTVSTHLWAPWGFWAAEAGRRAPRFSSSLPLLPWDAGTSDSCGPGCCLCIACGCQCSWLTCPSPRLSGPQLLASVRPSPANLGPKALPRLL